MSMQDPLADMLTRIRNAQMADYADILLAFWDGESKGTKHMINLAEKKDLDVYCFNY